MHSQLLTTVFHLSYYKIAVGMKDAFILSKMCNDDSRAVFLLIV